MPTKKKKKKTSTNKRRMSGVKDIDIQTSATAIAGAVGAFKITSMMQASTTDFVKQAAPYTPLVAGLAIQLFGLGKHKILKDLSIGLICGGGITAVKQLAPKFLAGPYQIPVVSGVTNRKRLNGGVNNPNAVGNDGYGGYSPKRNSVNDTLSVIAGMPSASNGY